MLPESHTCPRSSEFWAASISSAPTTGRDLTSPEEPLRLNTGNTHFRTGSYSNEKMSARGHSNERCALKLLHSFYIQFMAFEVELNWHKNLNTFLSQLLGTEWSVVLSLADIMVWFPIKFLRGWPDIQSSLVSHAHYWWQISSSHMSNSKDISDRFLGKLCASGLHCSATVT